MTIDTKDILNSILASISRIDYIKPDEIPGIDLYMDQVTTFMENHLSSSKRHPEDKVLTKTMINNYAKNHLVPPPVKKKYSREHILMLTFIYYFKNIMSINDIQVLLGPIAEEFFPGNGSLKLQEVYQEIMDLELEQIEPLIKDVSRKFNKARSSFSDADEKEQDIVIVMSGEKPSAGGQVFQIAEEMPSFPGGIDECMRYIARHVKYPAISIENGAQGIVSVRFIIEKDGSISNPKIAQGVDEYLDKEAMRVIMSMPKWKPGKQRGVAVRTQFTLPVKFRLVVDEAKKDNTPLQNRKK